MLNWLFGDNEEPDTWDEDWPIGASVSYLGKNMIIASNRQIYPHIGSVKCLTVEYVDSLGVIRSHEFLPCQVRLLHPIVSKPE